MYLRLLTITFAVLLLSACTPVKSCYGPHCQRRASLDLDLSKLNKFKYKKKTQLISPSRTINANGDHTFKGSIKGHGITKLQLQILEGNKTVYKRYMGKVNIGKKPVIFEYKNRIPAQYQNNAWTVIGYY